MRFSLSLLSITLLTPPSLAFAPHRPPTPSFPSHKMTATSNESTKTSVPSKPKKRKELAFLTFDLDDTLYPVATVINEANGAFARAMTQFGYDGIQPQDIVSTGKAIREEMALTDPAASAALSHTEIRRLAIRKEVEDIECQRKLQSCADDWATQVSSLSPLVVENAKKWATSAISPSIVEAILNAWEMERHHAAERNLYPEVMTMFETLKKTYPNVIIGAVTDGKANPLFMTFTLAKHFDFCINWEDDQAGRKKFFMELSTVEEDADLTWIYSATKEKGMELFLANQEIFKKEKGEDDGAEEEEVEYVWIHVGDDLALDVGGSSTCGAKTILCELDDKKYGQTARHRFDNIDDLDKIPGWNTAPIKELMSRRKMNELAEPLVDQKVSFMSHIPDAVRDILAAEEEVVVEEDVAED